MPDIPTIAAAFSAKGMDAALDGSLIDQETVGRAVNMRLERQLWRNRHGFREIPFLVRNDDDVAALDEWAGLNHQGAMFYNPARGQGAMAFGIDQASILQSAAGRKFRIRIFGRGMQSYATLEEVTGGVRGHADLHLAWWAQPEQYAVCSDGETDTWIYDGMTGRRSAGLEATGGTPEVPSPCSAMAYAHGRLHCVTRGRFIIVGDQLHLNGVGSTDDVIKFSQMQDFVTAQIFAPPSAMGNTLALNIMAMKNTQHGHEGIFSHNENGLFSLNTNVAPRSSWDTIVLSRHALLKTAAAGPYAVSLWDGDLVFRSRYGIQTFRSAAFESQYVGNPYSPLSEEVRTFMDGDNEPDLRFASVSSWYRQRRLLATVYPMMRLRHRWHRGFIVANFNPRGTTVTGERAWEGLWTLPPEFGGVIQFIDGIFLGEERQLAFTWDPIKERMMLIEALPGLEEDVLADGTRIRISCQLQTRKIHVDALFAEKKFSQGRLYLRDAQGEVDWGVFWRGEGEGQWVPWKLGRESVVTFDENTLEGFGGRDLVRPLGEFPKEMKGYRHIQLMVRIRGSVSLEAIKPRHGKAESEDDFEVHCDDQPIIGRLLTKCYNDYEYSEETGDERWEAK